MTDLIYNRRLEEAKELLALTLKTLKDMTTQEFSHGADYEIRMKIAEFLRSEENE